MMEVLLTDLCDRGFLHPDFAHRPVEILAYRDLVGSRVNSPHMIRAHDGDLINHIFTNRIE